MEDEEGNAEKKKEKKPQRVKGAGQRKKEKVLEVKGEFSKHNQGGNRTCTGTPL